MSTRSARLIRHPATARLMALSLAAKLSSPMLGVALLFAVVTRSDSYGLAGA